MIARAATAVNFYDLAKYLDQDKIDATKSRASFVWRHECFGASNPRAVAEVMAETAALNGKVEKPVLHIMVSFGTDERPTYPQMQEVATRLMKDLELGERQAMMVAHTDRPHPHFHLMINRVDLATCRCWSDKFSYPRIEKSLRRIEADMGFRITPGTHAPTSDGLYSDRSQARSTGAYRMEARSAAEAAKTGTEAKKSFLTDVRNAARRDLTWASSWRDLELRLARKGLKLERQRNGLAVTDGIHGSAVSHIAPDTSLRKLEDRFQLAFDSYEARRPASRPQPGHAVADLDF